MSGELYAVIMAGGGGTRLWPVSRRARPKQTLRLVGERSLFQMAVDRLAPLVPPARTLVVTVGDQAGLLRSQAPELPAENYILEPMPRGTASVIGLAAVVLEARSPGCVMACLTADHYIADAARFREALQAAHDLALQGELVTLGISPTHPDTGYGYIQRGELHARVREYCSFRVRAFKEKPGLAEAQTYLDNGAYLWNSGMFIWRAGRILAEIERQMPALHAGLQTIRAALGRPQEQQVVQEVWRGLASQTIDYGVMEGAEQVAVIQADDLGWCDIGSWDRLFDVLTPDSDGNLLLAPATLAMDTRRSLVYQDAAAGGRLIATLGVEGLVIVDAGDVLLVCPRERAEEVRRLVARLSSEAGEALT